MIDAFETLASFLHGDVCVRWLIAMLHLLWQGALVGGLVGLAAWLLRGSSAQARYVVYSAGLLALPVCVAVTFCMINLPANPPSSRSGDGHVVATAQRQSMEQAPAAINTADEQASAPSIPAATPDRGLEPGPLPPMSVADPASTSSHESVPALVSRYAPWIAAVYAVGVSVFLLRLLTAMWGGWRVRALAVQVTDAHLLKLITDQAARVRLTCVPVVAYCERVAVPTVIGVLRPMILLPATLMTGLAPEDFAALIRHELAHIRRFDLWMNLLQRVIESLLFFHPVTWFISRRLSAEREVCCDDLVVSSGCEPMKYAGALLRMAELCTASRPSGGLALAAGGDQRPFLERRIERLIDWRGTPRLQLTRAGMAGLLATLVLMIIVPGVAPSWALVLPPAAESTPPARSQPSPPHTERNDMRLLLEPTFRLPDRWILEAVRFDNGGRELVTASMQGFTTIRRWDLVERKLISEIKLIADKHARPVRAETLTLSADCRRVAAATDEYIGIWDTVTGKLLAQLPIPRIERNDTVHHLAATPDLSIVAADLGTELSRTSLAYDAHAIVWDVTAGKTFQTITQKSGNDIFALALTPDGKMLATTSFRGNAIWDTRTGQKLHDVPEGQEPWRTSSDGAGRGNLVRSIEFSPDGRQLAIGGSLGVELVDTQTGSLLRRIDAPYRYSSFTPGLVFSRDGELLARLGTQTGDARSVPIWSTRTGRQLYELRTESDIGAFCDDGRRFAVGFSDLQMGLAIWQLTGEDMGTKQGVQPAAEPRKDRVEENGHYRGKVAADLIEEMKPVWGPAHLGIQCGVALTRPQREFRVGERVPLVLFFRNVSDRPIQIDMRPDLFWNTPTVLKADSTVVDFETLPLLGTIAHYRDQLEPGEAFGPLYFGLGLGENPLPGKQHWHPYWKTPAAGAYTLTHTIAIQVADPHVGDTSAADQWKAGEVSTGQIEFKIVDLES